MPGSAKVNGTWQDLASVSAKVNGSWKDVIEGYSKVNGTWQQWFAPGGAMTLVETVELTSASSQLQFSGINSLAGKHLVIKGSVETAGSRVLAIRFNSLTGSNYGYAQVRFFGDSWTSDAFTPDSNQEIAWSTNNGDANSGFFEVTLPNFKKTNSRLNTHTRFVGGSTNEMIWGFATGTIRSNITLSSIQILTATGQNLEAGTKLSLYTIEG